MIEMKHFAQNRSNNININQSVVYLFPNKKAQMFCGGSTD